MTARSPLDPEHLLVHAPFVRALARSLVREDSAEDLVQHTWARALEHPPADAGRLRSWLASVVRNLAVDQRRSQGARDRREAASARPDRVPSVDEITAREALRRDVVEAVSALPEPSRSVVLLRYYEGMPPREIARELGIPVETVRTRLKRGLARLRGQLDTEYGDTRWSLTMAALAYPPTAPTPLVSTVAHGLRLAASPAGLAAVVLLTAGTVAVLLRPWGPGPAAPTVEAPGTPLVAAAAPATPGDPGPEPAAGAAAPALLVDRSPAPQDDALRRPALRGRLRDVAAEGERAYLVGLSLPLGDPEPSIEPEEIAERYLQREAAIDAEGRFVFEALPEGLYYLGLAPSPTSRHQLASVILVGPAHAQLRASLEATLAESARAANTAIPSMIALAMDAVVEAELASQRPGTLRGIVVDENLGPIAGAELIAFPSVIQDLLNIGGDSLDGVLAFFGATVQSTISDEEGRFEIVGPWGDTQVAARSARHRATATTAPVGADEAAEVRLQLREAARFDARGRVLDPAGDPVPGAVVVACTIDRARDLRPQDLSPEATSTLHRTVSDEEGSYRFENLRAASNQRWELDTAAQGALALAACAEGTTVHISEPLAFDRVHEGVDLVLQPGKSLHVLVSEMRGRPLAQAEVILRREGSVLHQGSTGEEGRFSRPALPYGNYEVQVSLVGYSPRTLGVRLDAGSGPCVIALEAARSLMIGRVVDPDGQPVPRFLPLAPGLPRNGMATSYFSIQATVGPPPEDPRADWNPGIAHAGIVRARLGDEGRFTLDLGSNWPGEEVHVTLLAEGLRPQIQLRSIGQEVEFVLDPDAVLATRSRVRFRAVDAESGRRLRDFGVDFFRDQEEVGHANYHDSTMATGWVSGGGSYAFRVRADGYASNLVFADLPEGSDPPPYEVPLRPESTLRLEVRDPSGQPMPHRVVVRVFDAAGRRLFSQQTDEHGACLVGGLAAGSYFVHADDFHGGQAFEDVLVLDGQEREVRLRTQATRSVPLEASDAVMERLAGSVLRVLDSAGRERTSIWLDAHLPEQLQFLPGRYTLVLSGPILPRLQAEISVPAEGTVDTVHLDDGR